MDFNVLKNVFDYHHKVVVNLDLFASSIFSFYNVFDNEYGCVLTGNEYRAMVTYRSDKVESFIRTSWFRTREGLEKEISSSIEDCFIGSLKIGQSKKIAVGSMRGDDALYAAFPVGIYEDVYLVVMINARYNDIDFLILQGNLDNYFDPEVIGRLPRCNDPKEMEKMGMILTEIKKETNFFDFGKVFRECIKDGTLSTGGA
jgi:hypothetical protein